MRYAILLTVLLGGCAARQFPRDPYVVYTRVPQPGMVWYCEKKAWGGARCDAMTPPELRKRAADNNTSLVCTQEKGFGKTCWPAQDIDDKGAYSY